MSDPATVGLSVTLSVCASVAAATLWTNWRLSGSRSGGAYVAETSDEDPRRTNPSRRRSD